MHFFLRHTPKVLGIVGHDILAVRGDMAAGNFSVYHFKGVQLLAVDSVNAPKDHLQARTPKAMLAHTTFTNLQP